MASVVGHQQARALLARAVAADQVSHAYLFAGPRNVGKTTLALAFAALLECESPDLAAGEACGVCASCRKLAHGNHPDVSLVEPEQGKRQLGVDAVRETVVRMSNLAPSAGRWRIFILPEAERMTPNTVNALLKTLEEPPAGVVLLLTTSELDTLLPTLLSRCQLVPVQSLPADEIAEALAQRWDVPPEEARTLAALANGRLGWAVTAHEQPELREERAEQLARITALAAASRDERIKAAGAFATDGDTARRVLELWTVWWRDVVLAACGATHLASAGDARREAERQGRALGCDRAQSFLRALVEAQNTLDANANPRLTLEVLLLDLPHISASAPRR